MGECHLGCKGVYPSSTEQARDESREKATGRVNTLAGAGHLVRKWPGITILAHVLWL